jgi:hypothetical protein
MQSSRYDILSRSRLYVSIIEDLNTSQLIKRPVRRHDMANPPGEPDAGQQDGVAPHGESPPGMPRWVKVAAIIIGILVVLFVVLLVTGIGGQHGPGRHMSASTPPATLAEVCAWLALSDG